MKRIKIGDLVAGLSMGVITFTGVTAIYHFSDGAVFSNAGTPTLSVSNTPPASATPTTIFGGPMGELGGGGGGSVSCIHGSVTFYYDGKYGWDGTPQYFTLTPSITACEVLYFALYGGGGGGMPYVPENHTTYKLNIPTGGSGGLTTGIIPISSISSNALTIIVGGGGGLMAGGGGSFVFSGSIKSGSILFAAGGGGGGSLSYNSSNGTITLYYGGAGGGGNQAGQSGSASCGSIPQGGAFSFNSGSGGACSGSPYFNNNGTFGAGGSSGFFGRGIPFGTGGINSYNNYFNGGYGGGGAGNGTGQGFDGAGGGSGYEGGGGERNTMYASGGGGSGFCAPIALSCGGQTGGARNGGVTNGGPGKVIIYW